MTRTTRSGAVIRGSSTSPQQQQQRGRVSRGSSRGMNRIQPIIWNQDGQVQMMGGKQASRYQEHAETLQG